MNELVWVPGGEFTMGSDRHYPEEAPAHRVAVDGFWMQRHPVTNAEYTKFVAATGHVTVAEQPPDSAEYSEGLPAASAVFTPPPRKVDLSDAYQWWSMVPGADWRHPRGPASDLTGLEDHPVVHVAWADVEAYARWADLELPTEAQWEYAARGGRDAGEYAWGDDLTPDGRHQANVWQGDFPTANDEADGFYWTSPVGAFPANAYGLVDLIGNVWEWTADWWSVRKSRSRSPACCGGTKERSVDFDEPLHLRTPRRVMKGGSYLCAPNYCRRYRPAARLPQTLDTSTCHLGFRCVSGKPETRPR